VTFTGLAVSAGLLAPAVAVADPPGFGYGVSAGEIRATSAMLWTRADTSGPVLLQLSRSAARTRCSLTAARPGLRRAPVVRRVLTASASTDNAVLTTVRGLAPATTYHYRFCARSATSRAGRFTTAPPARSSDTVRFGLTGDADGTINPATNAPAYNRFEVYRRMVTEGNDFNVNLGDVMYSDSAVAGVPPALSLPDKWAKYRLNLSYPNLRRLRSSTGLYSHWDDHEFVDDFSVPVQGQALFDAGRKAFLDYNPVRYRRSTGLYRTFRGGRNVDMFFLDERALRSAPADTNPACQNPVTGLPEPLPELPENIRATVGPQLNLPSRTPLAAPAACAAVMNDPARTMLGKTQLHAFENAVRRSHATFKIIINEVPIQQIYWEPYDRWEGYGAERDEILRLLMKQVRNVLFLTTDFHANLVNRIRLNTFPDHGASVDTGMVDIVTGPVALKTMAVDTDLKTGRPGASEIMRRFFKAPRPAGLGMSCAALNTYSYAEVTATSAAVRVTLKDAAGRPVTETPSGPTCPSITIPRR
jgi:phosphodiesterase/alkaline phosphatase D-like protein